jgi:poly-beta-hydroxybutyrate-responsive repressor
LTTNKKESDKKQTPLKNDKMPGTAPKNLMIPALLLTLSNWSLHGYKLIQELTRFGFTSVDQGNVYRILRQMEKDNLIKSEWDTTEGGPAKRIYSITEAGKNYLQTCTDGLEQYQSILNRFFSLYMDMFLPNLNKEKNSDD